MTDEERILAIAKQFDVLNKTSGIIILELLCIHNLNETKF